MKTQLKRFSKSTISVLLAACLLFSCMTVGLIATSAAQDNSAKLGAVDNSESVGSNTSDGTARLFFNMSAVSWWIADSGNQNFAYFFNNTTNTNAWSAHSVQQTGNYYYVVVPSGTWEGVILTRNNTTTSPSWSNKWNQTGDITWTAGKNYISAFSENSTTATLSTYQLTSTASLGASSTSITTAETSTLTPSLSSNTAYNTIKSTSYSVTTNPGSAGSVTSAGVFSATAAGTYTVTATVTYNAIGFTGITKTATATKTITVTSANTPLTAPSITYNNSSATTQTMDASKGNKARISWSAVSNAGSYEVYKGSTKVTTTTNTYYDIERGYSYGGAYTVKAVPSDTATYSTSSASNSITFTFNKVAQPAPTVSGGSKTINSGTVTYTLSGGTGTLGTDFKYQHTAANGSSYSDVTNASWTTGSMSTAGTYVYKFKTVAVATDYYSDSASVTSDTITVRTAYKIYYVDSSSQSNGVFTNDSSKAMTYDSTANAYYASFTVTNTTKFYYRMATTNLSTNKEYATAWNGSYPGVYDVALGTTSSTGVTATTEVQGWDNKSSLHYSGSSPKIIIWYNGTKTWITDNATQYNVTITQPTGGTVKVEDDTTSPQSFYEDDTVNYTVTANSGYVITGVTVGGNTTSVDRKSSYTGSFTISGNTTVTATLARQYSITASSATGGTYTVKRGSTAVTTFIPGDSLTLTPTAADHYDFTKFTISGGKSTTLTENPSTLDTTGATANITITPTWTAKSYSYTTNAKYSTDGSSYNTALSAGVTPASGNATNATGVTVTAPATVTVSNVKYTFVDFIATSGTVTTAATSGSNKTTTFKPTAANAVCTARYKKVYTITTSVDNTGTGAGTVGTNVEEVAAGGSYTITSTAKSGSAIESVKVNGTSKGTSASTTVSSVTDNQTVVVKFKSLVHVIGGLASSGWTEPGDELKSNADGTSFSVTISGKAAGTYDFQHYLGAGSGGTYDSSSTDIASKSLSGIATLSAVDNGYGGKKFQLVLTVTSNITLVSDGSKFTSITVVPDNVPTYNVTLKKVAGSTITCTYMGTEYTTASADAVVPVYSGTEISFTVTADSDKYISALTSTAGTLSPAFSAGATYTGKIASVAAAATITPTVSNKLKVTCTTNKTAWGTVSTSPEYAVPGDTVTISYTAASGILKTLTAYNTTAGSTIKVWQRDSSGDMKVVTGASANQATQVGITGLAGSIYSFLNKAGEALGASDDSAALGADDALTFTMPSGAVTVTATYEEYVGTSDYYYNYYSSSGKGTSSQLSEGKINGNSYGYYNVTDRTESDQLFTVSHRTEVTGTRYVYFTNNYTWDNLHVYFFDGVSWDWPGDTMTFAYNNSQGQAVYKYAIPSDAKKVIFNNGQNGVQTQNIDLTTTCGAYYLTGDGSSPTATEWGSDVPSDAGINGYTETEYFSTQNDSDIYPGSYQAYTDAGLFNDHGIGDTRVAKPKGDTFDSNKNDYYILVFYPGVTYTVNGDEFTPSGNPLVYWSATLPGQEESTASYVKVYAKDGTIRRDGDTPERNNMTYSYFEQHANTFVYSDSGYASHIGTRSSHDGQSSEGSTGYNGYTYDYIQKFEKGQTLYIKTNMDSTLLANHYLVAYSINGKCYKLHGTNEGDTNGYVTEAFTVPEDFEDNYIEITPIYFPKDASNCITFYIEGYDETVMNAGWGNTPYVYPFYQDQNNNYVANINNAFGGYPGQPMVFYQGNYYTMLPKQYTTTPEGASSAITCTVKGVTLGNGYWDDIHILTGEVKSHFQTYDYDDLYKIYKEYIEGKGTGGADADRDIICSFKYRTKKNNDEPSSMNSTTAANYNSTNGNGWEVLTDYYGRPVDVFGTLLTGDALTLANSIIDNNSLADSASVVHAISQDYKSNSAGDYGTEWAIYNTSGTKVVATSGGKTTIVPSALAISNTNDFANYDSATKAFQSIYDALKADTNVVGKPVVVSYEKSIYGGSDKADRCDARWAFSTAGEPITATTRIEYTDDGKNWITDTYTSGTGTGSHTGTKAYFTGKASTATDTPTDTSGVSGENTTSLSGTTGGGYYTFNAKNAGQYEFVGWYLLRDNYQNISVRSSYASDASQFPSHAQQSKNGDIFVARFKKTATGTFDIYHEVHPQTSGYGHVYVSAVVKDSGETQVASYPASGTTDHVQIPSTYIRSGEGYTVEATFSAVPYGTSNFEAFYATVSELLDGYTGYDFIKSITVDTANKTATVIYDVDKLFSVASGDPVQTVTSVTHYSKFSLKTDLKYSLTYTFNTRYYGTKLYKYTNENFTEQELKSYFYSQITNDSVSTIEIDKQFVQRKAPFESNYREDLTWNVDNVTVSGNTGNLTATQVPATWANAVVYDFHNDGTFFTYQMAAPYDNLFKKAVQAKPADASEAASAAASWNDPEITFYDLYDQGRWTYTESGETKQIYIDHWDIYQLDSFTYNTSNGSPQLMDDGINLDVDTDKSVLVAQTYSARFNYIGYEDYAIVPVYSKTYVDRQGESDDRTDCSATLLTITRNHWNETASGNTQGGKYKDSADRIYVDFMLNYNYSKVIDGKNTNVQLSTTGDNIKVGFIIKSYTVTNTGTESVKTYSGKSQVVMVDKSDINNKNRLEYCYGFNNSQNNSKWGQYYEFTPFIIDTNAGTTESEDGITLPDSAGGGKYLSICKDTVTPLDNVTFYRIGNSDVSWAS